MLVVIKKMNKIAKFFNKITIRSVLPIVGILLIILTSIFLLWQGNANSKQSISTTPAGIYFVGEYRIGDGEWKEIVKGEHISSTKGDVTLRGNFHYTLPNGEYKGVFTGKDYIAFYVDHISLTFKQSGQTYIADHENPIYGQSACGIDWK